VKERESEREREWKREREKEKERDKQRDRQTERQTDRETDRQRDRQTQRQSDRYRDIDRDRDRGREKKRERHRKRELTIKVLGNSGVTQLGLKVTVWRYCSEISVTGNLSILFYFESYFFPGARSFFRKPFFWIFVLNRLTN
jgi:hypothetical protein